MASHGGVRLDSDLSSVENLTIKVESLLSLLFRRIPLASFSAYYHYVVSVVAVLCYLPRLLEEVLQILATKLVGPRHNHFPVALVSHKCLLNS